MTAPDADGLAAYLDEAYRRGIVRSAAGDAVGLAPHSIERDQSEAMRDLAIAEGAERTVEVGLGLGMSALFLCQGCCERRPRVRSFAGTISSPRTDHAAGRP